MPGGRQRARGGGDALLADQALEPGGRDHEQQSRSLLAGDEAVGNVARPDDDVAGTGEDRLVAHMDGQRSLEHDEGLLLAVVDVQRGHAAGTHRELDHGEAAAGLLAGHLDHGEVAPPPARLAGVVGRGRRAVGLECVLCHAAAR